MSKSIYDLTKTGYTIDDIKGSAEVVKVTWQRGYVSRVDPPRDIFESCGKLFYLEPDPKSTRYCHRVYIKIPGGRLERADG